MEKRQDSETIWYLHREAEEIPQRQKVNIEELSLEESRYLLYELYIRHTELEQQNQQLRQQLQQCQQQQPALPPNKYTDLYHLAPAGYITTGKNSSIIEANATAAQLFGVGHERLLQSDFTDFMLPEHQYVYHAYCEKLLKTQTTQICTIRLQRPDGSFFLARLEGRVVYTGTPPTHQSQYHLLISDISREPGAQELLHTCQPPDKRAENIRLLIENNADAMIVNSKGKVRFVNPAAEKLFGRSRQEMLNHDLGIPISADKKAEVDIYRKQEGPCVAEMHVTEIEWQGEPAYLASFRDITTHKQLEEELERQVAERTATLEQSSRQLFIELTERQRAEQSILHRDTILEVVNYVVHCLLKNTSFKHEIAAVLKHLGMATGASRVSLFTLTSSDGAETTTFCPYEQWVEENSPFASTGESLSLYQYWLESSTALTDEHYQGLNLTTRNFPRWKERLRHGASIYGHVRAFPPDERQVLEAEHISSVIVVPVFVDQEWWGFVEIDEWQNQRDWLMTEAEALATVANVIGLALHREQVQEALHQSEQRFRTVADFTYDWVYWLDADKNYLYVSPSCQRITGYAPQAFLDNPNLLEEIVHPDDRERVLAHMNEHLCRGGASHIHFRILTHQGEERWIGHVCQPVHGANGDWLGRRASNRDITDQVRAEEAYRTLVDHSLQGLVIFQDQRIAFANPTVTTITGYSQEELLALSTEELDQLIHPDDREMVWSYAAGRFAGRPGPSRYEYRIVRKNGEIRYMEVFATLTQYRGQPADQVTYIDITDRVEAKRALQESTERFQDFVEGTDNLICQLDSAYHFVYVNYAAERVFGIAADECIGRHAFDFVHLDDRERTRHAFDGWIGRKASNTTFENRQTSSTGITRHMRWTFNLHYTSDGSLKTINAIAHDISDQKRVEEALRNSESRYRTISDLISDFAYALQIAPDGSLTLEWVTNAFTRTTGFTLEEIQEQGGWDSLIHPQDRRIARQSREWLLAGQSSDVCEFRIITRDGEVRWLRNHSRPVWDAVQGRVAHIYGAAQDITEWYQAMQALRESEQKFHGFFDQSRDGLVLINDQGHIIDWNKGAENIWSLPRQEVVGRPIWDVLFEVAPEDHRDPVVYEQARSRTVELLKMGQVPSLNQWVWREVQRPDGTRRFVHSIVFPIQTDNGLLLGNITRDITEQKRAEKALRESEERYRQLIELTPDLIAIHSEEKLVYINQAGARLLGASDPQELIGRAIWDVVVPSYHGIVAERIRTTEQQQTFTPLIEEQFIRLDNQTTIDVEVVSSPFTYQESGAVLVIAHDITERKKAEEALRQNEQRFRNLTENAPDIIYRYRFKPTPGYDYISPAVTSITGYTPEEYYADPILHIKTLHPNHRPSFAPFRQSLHSIHQPLVLNIVRKDGQTIWLEQRTWPVLDNEGNIVAIEGILRDITLQTQAEEAIRQARSAAESAARTKSKFLANTSHEIRTPMNAIAGMTSLLLNSPMSEEQYEWVETIRTGSDMLLSLINDILDLSRIEAGKLVFDYQPFDLRACVEETLDLIAFKANEKQLALCSNIDEHIPSVLVGDKTRLRQVLLNLLSNAVKFTEQGEVVVSIGDGEGELNQAGHGHPEPYSIHLSVRDTGIGIPPHHLERLFKSFSQVDPSTTRKYGGTGLGLSISKQLVELMGGRVWVESEVGQGSTFHVLLPLGTAPDCPEAAGVADDTALPDGDSGSGLTDKQVGLDSEIAADYPYHILVAEDNTMNQRVVVRLLERMGYHPDVVTNGQEVLEALQRQPYDVVLMDVQMPEMDGIEATRQIRAQTTDQQPWVIALTACALNDSRDTCLSAGMNDYISKPVNGDELAQAIIQAQPQTINQSGER